MKIGVEACKDSTRWDRSQAGRRSRYGHQVGTVARTALEKFIPRPTHLRRRKDDARLTVTAELRANTSKASAHNGGEKYHPWASSIPASLIFLTCPSFSTPSTMTWSGVTCNKADSVFSHCGQLVLVAELVYQGLVDLDDVYVNAGENREVLVL